jgi:hypothetical protein
MATDKYPSIQKNAASILSLEGFSLMKKVIAGVFETLIPAHRTPRQKGQDHNFNIHSRQNLKFVKKEISILRYLFRQRIQSLDEGCQTCDSPVQILGPSH